MAFQQKNPRESRAAAASKAITDQAAAETAMQPNPHPLFWVLSLFLFFACFAIAGVTWVYVGWAADLKKLKLKRDIWFFGFGLRNRILNMEVAPDGYCGAPSYDPQARFKHDPPNTNPLMPRVGAGVYLSLFNLLVLGVAYYFIVHVITAIYPYTAGGHISRFCAHRVSAGGSIGRDCLLLRGLSAILCRSQASCNVSVEDIRFSNIRSHFAGLVRLLEVVCRRSELAARLRADHEPAERCLAGFSSAFPGSGVGRLDLLTPGPAPSLSIIVPAILTQGRGGKARRTLKKILVTMPRLARRSTP